jgi:hypothetical protein
MGKKTELLHKVINALASQWCSEGVPVEDKELEKEVKEYCFKNNIIIEEFNDSPEDLIPADLADIISEIILEQSCGGCPEAYNAEYRGEYLGYLRLRWGNFTVDNKSGVTIFSASPKGDGIFEYGEREFYLTQAKIALAKTI